MSEPAETRTDRVYLRPLVAADAELDYDAVMSSCAMLRRWGGGAWPRDDFTLQENRADLERHEREHLERVAFTFTVLNPRGNKCLGCVYFQPPKDDERQMCKGASYPMVAGFWVRESEIANDLDAHLFNTLRTWLQTEWAFDRVLFVIRPAETRQVELFRNAGLTLRQELNSPKGRHCHIYA